jgi:hypothetical protein
LWFNSWIKSIIWRITPILSPFFIERCIHFCLMMLYNAEFLRNIFLPVQNQHIWKVGYLEVWSTLGIVLVLHRNTPNSSSFNLEEIFILPHNAVMVSIIKISNSHSKTKLVGRLNMFNTWNWVFISLNFPPYITIYNL